jgi:myo-inositol-1(or 4)-monophosphatase
MEAGALLCRGFGTCFGIASKPGIQNLVTEYDQAAEECIIAAVRGKFPDHAMLAEESGESQKGSSPVTWIVDPLDGTVNFAHGVPVFSVSIAAAVLGKVVVGVIFQPVTRELFTAESGKGARLNGRQIFVSKNQEFKSALMVTEFPYNVDRDPQECIGKFGRIQRTGVPVRVLGSAALDLAYVAAGRCDAFWGVGLNPWDVAAGRLLVEEAEGKVTHWNGTAPQIFGCEPILATNGLLHEAMLEHLKT